MNTQGFNNNKYLEKMTKDRKKQYDAIKFKGGVKKYFSLNPFETYFQKGGYCAIRDNNRIKIYKL